MLISSQGLMQIGWCTINCRFNQEVHTREGRGSPKEGLLLRASSEQSPPGACLAWMECAVVLRAPSLQPFFHLAPLQKCHTPSLEP